MKKLLLTLVAVIGFAALANAQLFIGGSVGVGTTGGKNVVTDQDDQKHDATFDLSITPKIGYIFNDKLSAGLGLGYIVDNETTFVGTDRNEWNTTNMFAVAPFVRYKLIAIGKFGINAELAVNLAFGGSKWDDMPDNRKSTNFSWGAAISPVLTFDLSSRITLESYLNFASLSYESVRTKDKVGDVTTTSIDNEFGLDFRADRVFTTGLITLGFVYKF